MLKYSKILISEGTHCRHTVTSHKNIVVLCYRQYMARHWGYETIQGAYCWDRRLVQSAWPELGRSSLRT